MTIEKIDSFADGSIVVTDNLGLKTEHPLSRGAIATHAALSTGVHGAGSDTLATNVDAMIWAIVFGG